MDDIGETREDVQLDEDKRDEFNDLLNKGSILLKLLTVTISDKVQYKIEDYKLDEEQF